MGTVVFISLCGRVDIVTVFNRIVDQRRQQTLGGFHDEDMLRFTHETLKTLLASRTTAVSRIHADLSSRYPRRASSRVPGADQRRRVGIEVLQGEDEDGTTYYVDILRYSRNLERRLVLRLSPCAGCGYIHSTYIVCSIRGGGGRINATLKRVPARRCSKEASLLTLPR